MGDMNNGSILGRRDFLKLGLLTTAIALTSSNSSSAAEKTGNDSSGGLPVVSPPIEKYIAKKYDHLLSGKLNGLSDDQLKAHFTLYEGYIKKINETEAKIKSFDVKNGDLGLYRAFHLTQTFALGGAVLHELYFGNLGATDKEPKDTLKKFIDRDFGNVQNFIGHLKLTGKAMRGWAIAALNFRTGKLHIYGLDQHHQDVPNMVYPILALDVYEHAYMIDYKIDRAKYLDVFAENLNWKPVQKRLETALSIKFGEGTTA